MTTSRKPSPISPLRPAARTAEPPSASAPSHAPVSSPAHASTPSGFSSEIRLTPTKHNNARERALDFGKVWAIVLKNWMVLKGDMARLLPLFLMPIVMVVIFGYAAGNLPKHLSTAVVDYDQTALSHALVEDLSSIEYFSIRYQVGTQDEGKRLLDAGKVQVLFILPQGLSDQVQRGDPAEIRLMVDESDSSVASAAKSAASSFSRSISQAVTRQRLQVLAARAGAIQSGLAGSSAITARVASANPDATLASASASASDAARVSAKTGASLGASIIALQNSMGYLVDQNEVVDSFNSASLGKAALTQLATGDSQASTLQQIAFYQSMQASAARLGSDAGQLSAAARTLAAQVDSQAGASRLSLSMQDAAGQQLALLSTDINRADNAVSLTILQPYGYGRRSIDFLLPAMLAMIIFQGATMNLGRAIAGERKDGSLTRVFLTPTSNTTIIFGTQLFYLLLEVVRSSIIIFVAVLLFGVTISGALPDILVIIALFAMGATGVGMVLSVMARSQEQYMALAMLVSMPIMFLSGTFFPVQTMPPILQSVAKFLPVTYASDALRGVMVKGFSLAQVFPDLVVLGIFGLFTLSLSLMFFKRELV